MESNILKEWTAKPTKKVKKRTLFACQVHCSLISIISHASVCTILHKDLCSLNCSELWPAVVYLCSLVYNWGHQYTPTRIQDFRIQNIPKHRTLTENMSLDFSKVCTNSLSFPKTRYSMIVSYSSNATVQNASSNRTCVVARSFTSLWFFTHENEFCKYAPRVRTFS